MESQKMKATTEEKEKHSLSKETLDSTSLRGFAAMDEETRKKIASKGGRSSRRNRVDWKNQTVIL